MSANGVDLGVMLQAVNDLSSGLQGVSSGVDALWQEMREMRRDMATKEDVALLRRTVTGYHSAVIGRGVLISDLDGRLRRVEQHLGLKPAA